MRAVGNGHTHIAKILLEAGADINNKNRYGATALILASGSRGSKELVELLLEHKAIIDTKDKEGKNALYYAQANNKHDIVALLKKYNPESSL